MAAIVASSFVTVIFINSVSFTEVTWILFLSTSSSRLIFKLDFTCLNMFLLFINSLYVDTSLEFNVMSVVVMVFVCLLLFPDANTSVVDELYF